MIGLSGIFFPASALSIASASPGQERWLVTARAGRSGHYRYKFLVGGRRVLFLVYSEVLKVDIMTVVSRNRIMWPMTFSSISVFDNARVWSQLYILLASVEEKLFRAVLYLQSIVGVYFMEIARHDFRELLSSPILKYLSSPWCGPCARRHVNNAVSCVLEKKVVFY